MTWPRPVLWTVFVPQDVACCQAPPSGERVATTLQKIFPKGIKIFKTIYFHIWSEYKAIIAGIITYRNILIKVVLPYRRQPINERRQITWHPSDSPMCPTFLSCITSKFVEIPDKTIVYKLTNVHEINLLTSHAEIEDEKWQAGTETW